MILKRKIVVVTGASYGLGLSICNKLLAKEAKVYGLSRSKPDISNPNFVWLKIDLTNDNDLNSLGSKIKEENIDILVNNAGTAAIENVLEFSDKSYKQTFDLNFRAPALLTSHLSQKFKNTIIINTSSVSDRFADKGYGLYCASKAALNIFFETLAVENTNIKVFNILPTYIDTPLQHKLSVKKDFDWNLAMNSDKVADCYNYMIENDSKFTSGTRMIVISNNNLEDIESPEKLWYYNIDTEKVVELK